MYLAALVVSLQRLVATTKVVKPPEEAALEKPLSKKERKKMRRRAREAEDAVKDMPAAEALGSSGTGETVAMDEDRSDVELVASIVSLIGLAVRGTSQAVLNGKCEVVLEALMNAYDHVFGNSGVSRHLSPVFAAVLAVLDSVSWSKPLVQRSYLYLLRQTADADSRARRRARDSLSALFMSPRASIIRKKTSGTAAAHFALELRLQTSALNEAINGDTVIERPTSPAALIYLLTTVERFGMFLLPPDAAKVSKELMLIAAKELANVTPFAYMALSAMFSHKQENASSDGRISIGDAVLLQADVGKLLKALLDHSPQRDCAQDIRVSYNSCVADAAIAYASYFPFASPPKELVITPVRIICDCISPVGGQNDITKNAASNLRNLLNQRWFTSRPEVLKLLHNFVGSAYRLRWSDMIPILKAYLEKDMAARATSMHKEVKRLTGVLILMRQKALDSNDKKLQDVANGVLSAIVRGGGVEQVLNTCAIQYDKKLHITNAWVLPILRDNICGAPLSLFSNSFIPLIDQLKEKIVAIRKEGRVIETKNLSIYVSQLWALLPGFCNKPTDLGHDGVMTSAFKSIHLCLSTKDEMSMQQVAVGALRQLALSLQGLSSEDPMTTEKRESFGSRLKKLFPAILGAAETTSQDKRRNLLEAVTTSCQATKNSGLVSGLLRKSIRRLLELQLGSSPKSPDAMVDDEDNGIQRHYAMADIAIAAIESGIVPHDAAELNYLEKAMSPFLLDAKQSSLQKKAYRAMALLVGAGSMSSESEELLSVAKRVAEAGSRVAPGAKALRQHLLVVYINQHVRLIGDEKKEYLATLTELFLSEIVLATRDTSEKTRSSAFETLITLARGWNSAGTGNDMTGLREFLVAVSAGLGGKTVPMLSATLTSLGRMIYEFRGEASVNDKLANHVDSLFGSAVNNGANVEMSGGAVDQDEAIQIEKVLPGPIAILLRHTSFEVQKAALGVVKIATKTLSTPADRLVRVLPAILPGLVHVAARSKKQETRLRVRVILERLLRKCGRDALEENFPQDHLKLLSAVRKKYSRDVIKKHAAKDRKRQIGEFRNLTEVKAQEGNTEIEHDSFGIEDSDSDIERELIDGDDLRSSQRSRAGGDHRKILRTKESKDNVLNLLDEKDASAVLTSGGYKETAQQARLEQKNRRFSKTEDATEYTRDGRPIFVESDDESGEVGVGSANGDGESDSDDEANERRKQSFSKRKRRRPENEGKNSKRQKGSFGDEYKSKKASGDVKRAGRPDPYAYIPLGMNMLGANPRSRSAGNRKGNHGSSLQRLNAVKRKPTGNVVRSSGRR